MVKEVFGFNTGRLYREDGQRISWTISDNRVYFNDHSRGIWGVLDRAYHPGNITPQILMRDYDHGEYSMDVSHKSAGLNAGRWPTIKL